MLRVSAVKELPALSRMGEVGAQDREGSSGEGRASLDRPDPIPSAGTLRTAVIWHNQWRRIVRCVLGGSMMLVEPRHT